MPTIRSAITALLLVSLLTSRATSDEAAVKLPEGVKAVWALDAAAREATPSRERICINGLWKWQPAEPEAAQPPSERWGYFKVPGPWPGITDYMQKDAQTLYSHPAWKDTKLSGVRAARYEREITIPEDWAGRRIALVVEQLNSLATVFVDGRPAGEISFPGGELDLTELAIAPGPHRLCMLVVALPLRGVMLSYTDSASARRVQGTVARRGLCGDVFLVATPPAARIDDVRITPSVRNARIGFDVALEALDPDASYTLQAVLSRGEQPVATFQSRMFRAVDVKEGHLQFDASWKPEALWDLHTPGNMLSASLSMCEASGATVDTFWRQRFGFRELEIQGRDFVLNGSRIQLCAVPLDNAQVSVALATYDAARESLERLKSFGINLVYTHNYGCEPGSHLSFSELLRAADDAGVLVALSQPHFSHYDWQAPDADRSNGYRRHAAYYTRVAGNHPSVVFYTMSHNATGYAEDMNPDLFGTAEPPRDTWASNNVKKAKRAEAIVSALDPSRIVYHHASGNLGVMHDTNFYPNFVPIQELSDWFETWSTQGVKPAFTCEYGAPFSWDWTMYRGWYKGKREFGSAQVPWEFCLAEWNAQFLGDRAYKITEAEKANLRWEARQLREGKVWHRWDYPHQVGSKIFDDRHEIIGRYLTDNFRAFRAWGVSAISPWEHDHYWRLKPDVDRSRKALSVDWDHLQRPGFSPDFIGPTYERMDLAFQRDDWEPTADAQALLRNNRPLLGYIAGKPEHFTAKDHIFHPGERIRKQLLVLNNSRQAVSCDMSWSIALPTPLRGEHHVETPTGEERRVPIEIRLPDDVASRRYTIEASFVFSAGETQTDSFVIDVLSPAPAAPAARPRIALFDPPGKTAALLESLGVKAEPVEPISDMSNYDVLIIGKGALTVDGPAPRVDRVRDGLQVVVFEQTSAVLEKRLGFRVEEYGLREVFPRVPDHPLLAGLSRAHLHDWRGEATLLPPRLSYEMRPMHGPTVQWCDIPVSRVWRCGNRGNVASVLIEKPACGDFLPIVDGGFSLQFSPLLEYREGRGRVVFCQLDVTDRTEAEPAAGLLVRNLLAYVGHRLERPAEREVVYAGEAAGLQHLRAAGFAASTYSGAVPPASAILVVGPGAALENQKAELVQWLTEGGRVLALGLDETSLASFLSRPPHTRKGEHIATFFEAQGDASPMVGVGPADAHNRDPRNVPLIKDGAELLGDGVLAASADGRVLFCQLAPWQFDDRSRPNIKRTFRRTAFLCSRLLANLGAATSTPLLDRIATPAAGSARPRFTTGLYLDQPEEWDDPYRFFRW